MPATRSTQALVEPAILNWARSSAGLSIEEAAHSLQTKPEKVVAWEGGEASPSMSQLRKMAAAYRRLLSDFYLPAPPAEEPLPHDFRRLPGDGTFHYSRALRYHLRQAVQRRLLALDLAAELEVELPDLSLRVSKGGDPEQIGDQVRTLLGVSLALQRTWREPRKSYNAWRAAIEGTGVLVFQLTGVSPKEILGFSVPERPCPLIAINRKLAPNGRTFTLLHEFVHVLLNQGSICDIEEDVLRPPEEQGTEVFCNAVAAAALVPRDALVAENLVAAYPASPREWNDEELSSLAHTFGVSIHVILRRLLTTGRTTPAFYAERLTQWRVFEQRPASDSNDEYRRNMPQEVVSDLGRPFTRLVLDSYLNSRMSLSDVARYLGLRAQQVQKVRELVLRGG
jgi:Zn-dependent peptidase ImmA (M78 family)/DNA-binding XRE family transcriptional regulator